MATLHGKALGGECRPAGLPCCQQSRKLPMSPLASSRSARLHTSGHMRRPLVGLHTSLPCLRIWASTPRRVPVPPPAAFHSHAEVGAATAASAEGEGEGSRTPAAPRSSGRAGSSSPTTSSSSSNNSSTATSSSTSGPSGQDALALSALASAAETHRHCHPCIPPSTADCASEAGTPPAGTLAAALARKRASTGAAAAGEPKQLVAAPGDIRDGTLRGSCLEGLSGVHLQRGALVAAAASACALAAYVVLDQARRRAGGQQGGRDAGGEVQHGQRTAAGAHPPAVHAPEQAALVSRTAAAEASVSQQSQASAENAPFAYETTSIIITGSPRGSSEMGEMSEVDTESVGKGPEVLLMGGGPLDGLRSWFGGGRSPQAPPPPPQPQASPNTPPPSPSPSPLAAAPQAASTSGRDFDPRWWSRLPRVYYLNFGPQIGVLPKVPAPRGSAYAPAPAAPAAASPSPSAPSAPPSAPLLMLGFEDAGDAEYCGNCLRESAAGRASAAQGAGASLGSPPLPQRHSVLSAAPLFMEDLALLQRCTLAVVPARQLDRSRAVPEQQLLELLTSLAAGTYVAPAPAPAPPRAPPPAPGTAPTPIPETDAAALNSVGVSVAAAEQQPTAAAPVKPGPMDVLQGKAAPERMPGLEAAAMDLDIRMPGLDDFPGWSGPSEEDETTQRAAGDEQADGSSTPGGQASTTAPAVAAASVEGVSNAPTTAAASAPPPAVAEDAQTPVMPMSFDFSGFRAEAPSAQWLAGELQAQAGGDQGSRGSGLEQVEASEVMEPPSLSRRGEDASSPSDQADQWQQEWRSMQQQQQEEGIGQDLQGRQRPPQGKLGRYNPHSPDLASRVDKQLFGDEGPTDAAFERAMQELEPPALDSETLQELQDQWLSDYYTLMSSPSPDAPKPARPGDRFKSTLQKESPDRAEKLERQRALMGDDSGGGDADAQVLAGQVAAVQQRLAGVLAGMAAARAAGQPQPVGAVPELQQLQKQLAELQSKISALGASPPSIKAASQQALGPSSSSSASAPSSASASPPATDPVAASAGAAAAAAATAAAPPTPAAPPAASAAASTTTTSSSTNSTASSIPSAGGKRQWGSWGANKRLQESGVTLQPAAANTAQPQQAQSEAASARDSPSSSPASNGGGNVDAKTGPKVIDDEDGKVTIVNSRVSGGMSAPPKVVRDPRERQATVKEALRFMSKELGEDPASSDAPFAADSSSATDPDGSGTGATGASSSGMPFQIPGYDVPSTSTSGGASSAPWWAQRLQAVYLPNITYPDGSQGFLQLDVSLEPSRKDVRVVAFEDRIDCTACLQVIRSWPHYRWVSPTMALVPTAGLEGRLKEVALTQAAAAAAEGPSPTSGPPSANPTGVGAAVPDGVVVFRRGKLPLRPGMGQEEFTQVVVYQAAAQATLAKTGYGFDD